MKKPIRRTKTYTVSIPNDLAGKIDDLKKKHAFWPCFVSRFFAFGAEQALEAVIKNGPTIIYGHKK